MKYHKVSHIIEDLEALRKAGIIAPSIDAAIAELRRRDLGLMELRDTISELKAANEKLTNENTKLVAGNAWYALELAAAKREIQVLNDEADSLQGFLNMERGMKE